jgi:hypothetical protein
MNKKTNKIIRDSLDNVIKKAKYNLLKVNIIVPTVGIFTSPLDANYAASTSNTILRMLKIQYEKKNGMSKEEIEYQMDVNIASLSYMDALSGIKIDRAVVKSCETHIKEAKEAIESLKSIGAMIEANVYERGLAKTMNEK